MLLRVTGCPPPFVCSQTDYLEKKISLSSKQTLVIFALRPILPDVYPLLFNHKRSSWPAARLTCPCVLVMCCCLCFVFFQQHTHVGRFFGAIRPICCPGMSPLPERRGGRLETTWPLPLFRPSAEVRTQCVEVAQGRGANAVAI